MLSTDTTLVVAVVVLTGVGFSLPAGVAVGQVNADADANTSASPTEISQCQVIDEPGRYVLTSNITLGDEDPCLVVSADDVVIDGQGHVFNASGGSPVDAVGNAQGIDNLTVRDVGAVGFPEVRIQNATDVAVVSGTASVELVDVTNATVAHNDVSTVSLRGARNVTVDHNDVGSAETGGGIVVADSETVPDSMNRVSENVTITNNTVRQASSGLRIFGANENVVVRHNLLTNNTEFGVRIADRNDVRIVRNNVTNNGIDGIRGPMRDVEIHHNNIYGNAEFGVRPFADTFAEIPNATDNYWGASNGPGSPTDRQAAYEYDEDAPYADVHTGRLADGDGDEVTGFEDDALCGASVSTVHFDPWLDSPVANAGPQNETAG